MFLAICMTLSLFTGFSSVNAVSEETLQPTTEEAYIPPDIVDPEETIQNGYIGRDKSAEHDLNTFVFDNDSGTKTMRVYSHPVKYLDSDGTVRDISLEINEKSNGGFTTASHEIITTFEKKLSDGIKLEYDDVKVHMIPIAMQTSKPTAKLSSDRRSVTYTLDSTTSYVYELTYAGFKEDIVVSKYTGQTAYSFTLFTNGLTLCEEFGSYYLADESGAVKATIGDIIVFTADERNNTMGSMTYETVRVDQEYKMTIHLDAEYLKDKATVYPIRIDPTIEYNYANNGAGAIEDVTINNSTTYSGTSGSLHIGRHSDGSLSRVLMRFPNLDIVPFAPMIVSANVEIRDIICQDDEDITVSCYAYKESAPSWSESSTTTWSSVGSNYIGTYQDLNVISYGNGNVSAHRYAFDITNVAKEWADGFASPEKGIVFMASSSFEAQTGSNIRYWYKTFASYNRSSNKPSLTIEYRTIAVCGIRNTATGIVNYLWASEKSAGGATVGEGYNECNGKYVWGIEYLPAYDAFNLVSLGYGYVGGEKSYVIYNNSSLSGLQLQSTSTSSRYRFAREENKSYNYHIQNVATNKYLSFPTDGTTKLTLSSSKNDFTNMYIKILSIPTFNSFFDGDYRAGIYDDVVHVQIKLASSITSHPLFKLNDFSSALLWNDISENVIIYGPNDVPPSGITPLIVTFDIAVLESYEYGVTVPDIDYDTFDSYSDTQKVQLVASDWSKVTIYLNNIEETQNPFYTKNSSTDRQNRLSKVICHEMGHALKLMHPEDTTANEAKHTFSGNRNDYTTVGLNFYSVMNSGDIFDSTLDITTAVRPQIHDKICLISKWEYHLNCSH